MNISYSQVEEQCNELHIVANNLKDIMQNIDSLRASILSGNSWSGEASVFYCKKIEDLYKNFEDVYLEIENSILYMASCSEGYQMIDAQIQKEICANLYITSPNLNTSSIFRS